MEPDEIGCRPEKIQALKQVGPQFGVLLPVLAVHLDRIDLLLHRQHADVVQGRRVQQVGAVVEVVPHRLRHPQ
jgi:hypothetical protein